MPIATGQDIDGADLDARAGERRATINTIRERDFDQQLDLFVEGLIDTTVLPKRAVVFTPRDTSELIALGLFVSNAPAGAGFNVRVVQDDGNTERFLGIAPAHEFPAAGGGTKEHSRFDFSPSTGARPVLFKGVRYRLEVDTDDSSATELVQAFAILRSRWRLT